jgi:hypothetical protein
MCWTVLLLSHFIQTPLSENRLFSSSGVHLSEWSGTIEIVQQRVSDSLHAYYCQATITLPSSLVLPQKLVVAQLVKCTAYYLTHRPIPCSQNHVTLQCPQVNPVQLHYTAQSVNAVLGNNMYSISHTRAPCGHNAEFLNITTGGGYSDHCASQG